LRVVTAQGHTYLEAWCHLAEDQRLFRLDRVSSAEVLDTAALEHRDVTPRDLSEGLFQPSPDDLLATVLLRPEARWVAEYYPVEGVEEAGEGALRVRLRVNDPAWLTQLMLRLGGAACVESPAGLREAVRSSAAAALAGYPS